jgi:two-component sensor histidine kinase
MDQALPCGLMVNELVSNALKHGFPDGRGGQCRIALQPLPGWYLAAPGGGRHRCRAAGRLHSSRASVSMGLQLVTQLCQQIGGTLEVHSRPGQGAAFSVSFRVDTPAPLVMPA